MITVRGIRPPKNCWPLGVRTESIGRGLWGKSGECWANKAGVGAGKGSSGRLTGKGGESLAAFDHFSPFAEGKFSETHRCLGFFWVEKCCSMVE